MIKDLHEERLETVEEALLASGAASVLDLGCGAGELLQRLVVHPQFTRIVGTDIDEDALDEARTRLGLGLPGPADRVQVRRASFEEPDAELCGFDAAALVETLEHVDPDRLSRVERVLFHHLRPGTVLVTTPNHDYNVLYGMGPHELRHPDHRFEWGRAHFRRWTRGVATRHGYGVRFVDVGPPDPLHGSSTQMAVFSLRPCGSFQA